MKKFLFPVLLFCSVATSAQTYIQAYQDRANQVTQTNINNNLQQFQALGVKSTGSTANTNALNWLKTKYQSFGYTTSQIVEDPFSFGGTTSKNLVVTKTGTLYPNTYVIICGHFDTINGPGTNDNGSGISVILEVARILQNVPTEYSIKFINFSGEEQGLYGSQHYVNSVVNPTNMDIKLVFNIDQVGGFGQENNTIVCERDQSTPNSNNAASVQMTNQLANCVGLYSDLATVLGPAYSSDYIPFENNGEIITGFYEYNGDNNTHPHSSTDTYANMNPAYVLQVAKAATGAMQHFAVAQNIFAATGECPPNIVIESLKVSPNPADDVLNLEMLNSIVKDFSFDILDLAGNKLIQKKNSKKIDVSKLNPGVYMGVITIDGLAGTRKIIIK